MEKNTKIALGVVGASILGVSIYYYFKNNAMKLMEMTYRFQNLKFNNLTFTSGNATGEIVLTNPSEIGFTITGYDLDIEFQGKKLANLNKSNSNIFIAPNQSVTIPFEVTFDPRNVGSELLPLFMDVFVKNPNQKMSLRYIGSVSAKYGIIGFKNIPVDYTYEW
jgi:LEA14-like dessication related protein